MKKIILAGVIAGIVSSAAVAAPADKADNHGKKRGHGGPNDIMRMIMLFKKY